MLITLRGQMVKRASFVSDHFLYSDDCKYIVGRT